MAGIVIDVLVRPGERVTADQTVAVMESMKMQIPIKAGRAGIVKDVLVGSGAFVNQGDVLLVVADREGRP